jgi:hypothetical protein
MNGLPPPDKRRNDVINTLQLFRINCNPLTAFAENIFIFLLRCLSIVQVASQSTAVPFLASVADVWRFLVPWTEFLLEISTGPETLHIALGTLVVPFGTTYTASITPVVTLVPVKARLVPAATFFEDYMVPDLF